MPRLILAFLWSISLRAQTNTRVWELLPVKVRRLLAMAQSQKTVNAKAGIFLRFYLSNNRTSIMIYCGGILWTLLPLSIIIELGLEC